MQFLFLEVKLLVVGISWNWEIQDLALFIVFCVEEKLSFGWNQNKNTIHFQRG